jgi:nitronate monooxygenase
MVNSLSPLLRARAFCDAFALRLPILMAPMAGASPASLAIAVANVGGLGGCGALLMKPEVIRAWAADVRSQTNGSFQINLWIPDPAPQRDSAHEERVREFLGQWGPPVAPEAGNVAPIDFAEQCEAMLDVGPATVSSIMGLYPSDIVARMKEKGIRWLANVTTVAEAREAVAAGADVIVAQGMEAGGHRGSFDAERSDTALIGLFALLPAVVDAIGDRVPVVATGRHRRCARNCGRPTSRCVGSTNWDGAPQDARGQTRAGMGRRHRQSTTRGHLADARLFWPARAQRRHSLRESRQRPCGAKAGTLSGTTSAIAGNA